MPDFVNYKGENIEAGMQATSSSDGLISAAEKVKLGGIATGANNYAHPATHPPSIIVQDTNNRFVTDAEKATWNAKASTAIATITANGLMSAADKVKLNGIAASANNYVHPTNHPASIITQDANNRFVTDAEKAIWNAKASTAVVTTTANGLMIAADKVKLNGIATGANAYTHPATHPPSIIAQDASNRFVTDAEKTKWNNSVSYEYGFDAQKYAYYKKYSDGTLEMWGRFDDPLMYPETAGAGIYYSQLYYIEFPVDLKYAGGAIVTYTVESAYPVFVFRIGGANYQTVKYSGFRIACPSQPKDFSCYIYWAAMGLWK